MPGGTGCYHLWSLWRMRCITSTFSAFVLLTMLYKQRSCTPCGAETCAFLASSTARYTHDAKHEWYQGAQCVRAFHRSVSACALLSLRWRSPASLRTVVAIRSLAAHAIHLISMAAKGNLIITSKLCISHVEHNCRDQVPTVVALRFLAKQLFLVLH